MKSNNVKILLILLLGMISMKAYATIGDEPYTGFDDVLIPEPALPYEKEKGQKQPWVIHREIFEFDVIANASVKTPENWGMEIGTKVYITHTPEDRHTTPKLRAEAWIKKMLADPKSNDKLIEQGTVKLPGIPASPSETLIEPYRFTIESNGVIDHRQQYADDERYVQRFYILPISSDEVVTVRAIRNKINDAPNTQFSTQWEHFLKTLKREVANTRSTTEGETYRTRRYYTHAFSFEIFKPDENTGNQWANREGADLTELWSTPQGEIVVDIAIRPHKDFLDMERSNKRIQYKAEAESSAKNTAAFAAEFNVPEPKLTYIKKPLGTTATVYGYRDDEIENVDNKDDLDSKIKLETVYKSGKGLDIDISGPKAAIDANEKLIYKWLADFKFLP